MSLNNNAKRTNEQEAAIELIKKACTLMGWGVILPFDENEDLHYMIIGTQDGIESAMARLNGEVN